MSLLSTLRDRFAAAVAAVTNLDPDDPQTAPQLAALVEMVKPSGVGRDGKKLADYQANMAMPLGKQLGRNPQLVAQQLIDALDVADLCERPEIAGPGFINLTLKPSVVAERAAAMLGDDTLGVRPTDAPQTVIIDFSSPNVAKPMHVGHLRSTVIGDALQRTLRRLGHRVISDNHVGDWGTQFGMILFGYKHLLDEAAYASDPVGELARLYRAVNAMIAYQAAKRDEPSLKDAIQTAEEERSRAHALPEPEGKKEKKAHKKVVARADAAANAAVAKHAAAVNAIATLPEDLKAVAESHDDIATAARRETAKLHAGDEENTRLWNAFLPQCLAALQSVYDRLGVRFDQTKGESHYNPRLPGTVQTLRDRGLATDSDGAVVVFSPTAGDGAAPLIVQKSDGAFTYGTTDLATIQERIEEDRADAILYVVDSRQAEHFDRVFEIARLLGDDYAAASYVHVSFGSVLDETGKPMKTRAGDNVGLESLLDEAVAQARAVVDENEAAKPDDAQLDEEHRQRVAALVGLGGIKYADLKHNRESDYKFEWSKMLAKNGDTATYMQYAYARTRSILRRAEAAGAHVTSGPIAVDEPAEAALATKLAQYPEALEAVAQDYRPNMLTAYLFELAGAFSTFFEQCPVLKADDEATRSSRLRLVDLTGRVIKDGLGLLGIETAEQM